MGGLSTGVDVGVATGVRLTLAERSLADSPLTAGVARVLVRSFVLLRASGALRPVLAANMSSVGGAFAPFCGFSGSELPPQAATNSMIDKVRAKIVTARMLTKLIPLHYPSWLLSANVTSRQFGSTTYPSSPRDLGVAL